MIALWLLFILLFSKRASGEKFAGDKVVTYSHHFIVAYKSILSPTEAFKERVRSVIIAKAVRHNIDPELFLRIAMCESGLNPEAKNPASSASGLFQFLPSTWSSWGSGDVFNVEDNINAAVRLFLARNVKPWLASEACWRR